MGGLHFGPAQAQLFGIYQGPATDADRDSGVVICNAFGPEYTRSHRALRQLAIRLTKAGHHVLRFDYRGSGDSAGAAEEADVAQWQADIALAVEALKDEAGVSRVSLVGLRLGAALACLAAAARRDIERVVLWEPVVRGPSYLQELRAMHAAFVAERPWLPRAKNRDEDSLWEIIGFPLPAGMRAGIASLALETQSRRPARRVLLVGDSVLPTMEGLSSSLRAAGVEVETTASSVVPVWRPDEDGRGIVPTAVITTIAGWLDGAR